MSPKHFTIILILLSALTCRAQSSIGISVHGNYSNRWSHVYVKDHYFFKSGYGFGVALKYRIKDKSYVMTQLSFEHLRHQEVLKKTYGVVTNNFTKTIIDAPVYYTMNFKSICLLFGAQVSVGLFDDSSSKQWYSMVDFGPVAGFGFNIGKKLSFVASVYQGLFDSDNFLSGGGHTYWTRFKLGVVYSPFTIMKRTNNL